MNNKLRMHKSPVDPSIGGISRNTVGVPEGVPEALISFKI